MSRFNAKGGVSPASQIIINNYFMPVEQTVAPDLPSRRAFISFTTAADTENVVVDSITYTFVAALGSPAANNVEVKVQASVLESVAMLSKAIRGEIDATNITYGAGVTDNPTVTAYWTGKQYGFGATVKAAGNNLLLFERLEDLNTAITLTSTTTCSITAFTRIGYAKYVLDGNNATIQNSIRGSTQMLLPISSVRLGGQSSANDTQTTYALTDLMMVLYSGISAEMVEVDFYYSLDEVTFTTIARSVYIGEGLELDTFITKMHTPRIPKGAGLYIKCGSNSNSATDCVYIKVAYHVYPLGV